MAVDQLHDEGSVIGYQPNLRYDKKINNKSDSIDSTEKEQEEDLSSDFEVTTDYHSQGVNSLYENNPNTVLENINFVKNNMNKIIDKLAKAFYNGNWKQYENLSSLLTAVDLNQKDYINDFVESYKNDIKSTVIPELICCINDTMDYLKVTEKVIKKLFYGDENISDEKAEEMTQAYLNKILNNELSQELVAHNNYAAIGFDSVFNKCISSYALSLNKSANQMSRIINKKDAEKYGKKKTAKLQALNKLFDEVNNKINYRNNVHSDRKGIEILEKTLYNYYNKRKDMLSLYSLLGEDESFYLGSKIEDSQNKITEAIKDMNRVYAAQQNHLKEMTELETEKHYIMQIYQYITDDK